MTALDPTTARIGFIGLGNVGGKLAGSLLRNGVELTVRDLDSDLVDVFVAGGATAASSPRELAAVCDVIITCLPSPAASASVMEADDGVIGGLRPGAVWLEMSTTDSDEIARLGALVAAAGGYYFLVWKNKHPLLLEARAAEGQLLESLTTKAKRAANLDAYRVQLAEMEKSFGAMLLDMYPKGRIDDAPYMRDQNPLDIATWFDAGNYTISKNFKFGNLWIQGGPRARVFFQDAPERAPAPEWAGQVL